jgi:hypothetical protein
MNQYLTLLTEDLVLLYERKVFITNGLKSGTSSSLIQSLKPETCHFRLIFYGVNYA